MAREANTRVGGVPGLSRGRRRYVLEDLDRSALDAEVPCEGIGHLRHFRRGLDQLADLFTRHGFEEQRWAHGCYLHNIIPVDSVVQFHPPSGLPLQLILTTHLPSTIPESFDLDILQNAWDGRRLRVAVPASLGTKCARWVSKGFKYAYNIEPRARWRRLKYQWKGFEVDDRDLWPPGPGEPPSYAPHYVLMERRRLIERIRALEQRIQDREKNGSNSVPEEGTDPPNDFPA